LAYSARGRVDDERVDILGALALVTPRPVFRIVFSVDDVDFSSVYERHAADVYRFALYMSGNIQTAEDVTAETFARAWTARGRIRVSTVKAYLMMIARNLCRDVHRRPLHQSLPEDHDVPDHAADQERSEDARQRWRQVVGDLSDLSEIDRSVLLMATLEDMTYRAIGEAVGLSEVAVKVRIHRTRVHLNAIQRDREQRS
jgi:RNA polymerase sigma-70 factor (ECF subfamily)